MLFQKLSRHTKPTWVFFFLHPSATPIELPVTLQIFFGKFCLLKSLPPSLGWIKSWYSQIRVGLIGRGGRGVHILNSPHPPPICKQQETQFRDLFFSIIYLLVTSLPPTPPCSTPSPQKLYKLYWPLLHYMYKSFSDALQIELNMSITQWMFV